jgi:hypothetical protein
MNDIRDADDINGISFTRRKIILGDDNFNDGDVSANNPKPELAY